MFDIYYVCDNTSAETMHLEVEMKQQSSQSLVLLTTFSKEEGREEVSYFRVNEMLKVTYANLQRSATFKITIAGKGR